MKNILTIIGAFLAGGIITIGGIAMADSRNMIINGVPATPENMEGTVDGNGNGSADVKQEEEPAPEDPLPVEAVAKTADESAPTNCVQ